MNKTDIQHIGRWLLKLRRSTAAGNEEVSQEQLAEYTMWLCQDFRLSAFTDASAKHIAEQSEFFPRWAVLRAGLAEWVDHHPEQPRIASAIPDSLARHIEELQDEQAWQHRAEEQRASARRDWADPAKIRAAIRNIGKDHPRRDQMGRLLAGLVRKYAPDNLCHIPAEWQ